MGRSPCCAKEGLNRGAWTASEDKILTEYIKAHGEGKWRNVPKKAVEKKSPSKSPKTEKDSNLIWTKASKCNKVVIRPSEPQNFDQDHQVIDSKQLAAGAGSRGGGGATVVMNNNDEDDHYTVKGGEALPEFNFQENNLSDFMMDLQMDEHLLSFLNSDFSQLSSFENIINNGGPSGSAEITNSCDKGSLIGGDDRHPNSNQTLLFCEEKKKLHDSDFPFMDSLIGSGFEWFQD
ncbi:hypothetical protein Pint_29072 [Pistacia integerrima]|uniref:Uncharacterized protein n=1 Tax=Pistacia integerrima TaxID=434235 RepID=A0ACC0X1P9_9ROSI|nr:hypothetical protein Pint_29072 [Pistacia integerrima]